MNLHDDDTLLEKFVELLSAPEKGGIRHMLQVALDAPCLPREESIWVSGHTNVLKSELTMQMVSKTAL
ncbi:MAG: hypothetical protein RL189_855 [Pseudomonadota bacterium]